MLQRIIIFIIFIVLFFNHAKGQGKWDSFIFDDKTKNNRNNNYFLLQLNETFLTQKFHEISIIRKLDDFNFIVEVSDSLFHKEHKKFLQPVNNFWKLNPEIDKNRNEFVVKANSNNSINKIKALPDVQVVFQKESVIYIVADYDIIIKKILPIKDVVYIGQEVYTPLAESRVLDMNLNPNGVNLLHHYYPQLNGEGMRISIKDNLYEIDDVDIRNRHLSTPNESSSIKPHATEMATVIGGAGNSSIIGKGVAPAIILTSSDFNPVEPDEDSFYSEYNIHVQNHSYGTAIESFYGVMAEAFDISAVNNPSVLHIFSSGNQGTGAGAGVYEGLTGYANLTGNYKMAKNILTIGAVDTADQEMYFSSKGPAYDGRVKPELVAYSTAGTSSATALVSGVSVLLQQAYYNQQGKMPSSALVKGALINSAEDVGRPGPDYATGYGNVDAYGALKTIEDKQYFTDQVSQGQEVNFQLEVPNNTAEVKVTLIWNDPAAQPNDNIALVNDLDLQLINGSESWWPWVLNPEPEAIEQIAQRGEDHLNNIEQINLKDPVKGQYVISIKGNNLLKGPQNFFVIYQVRQKNNFRWLYPTGSDNMPYNGESASYFRWENTFPNEYGKLEYSIDNGQTWRLISEQVELAKGHYRWEVPFDNVWALARMTFGDKSFVTDTFTISRPVNLEFGFHCGDSVMINWPHVENAPEYKIYTLGDKYVELHTSTSDTFLVYHQPEINSSYISVQPSLKNSTFLRSALYNLDLQAVGCYVQSFYSHAINDQGIKLMLNLGTNYGVDKIIFERFKNTGFSAIDTITSPEMEVIIFDDQPREGINTYRAIIYFLNGEKLLTKEISDLYLSETDFIVYPNPINKGEYLNIISKVVREKPVYFELYNQLGVKVRKVQLTSLEDYLPLPGLPAGLYNYTITSDGVNYRGKIIIR